MKIDLHNHTTYSDGVLSCEELVLRAKRNGVSVFALTDHDSVFGCEEAFQFGLKYGVYVIKGLELSTYYKGESVHIVCLFHKNIIPEEWVKFSEEIIQKRRDRAIQMMQNIENIYHLKVDIPALINENVIITRANMLRNVAENNAMSLEEASFYVSKESKAYIPSTKWSVKEGLELARKTNCFTILAHPCLLKEEYVEEILTYGFDGMEVYYPSEKNREEYFKDLAVKYHLFYSGGSDCHGDSTHGDIGTKTLNWEEFQPILSRLEIAEEEVKKYAD